MTSRTSKPVLSGPKAKIHAYVDPGSRCLVEEFVDGLQEDDQIKVMSLLQKFVDEGEIWNYQKFRKEEGEIYAFKAYQVRILCFFLPRAIPKTVVLTHAFIKKQDKLPRKELKKAERIRREVVGLSIIKRH